MSILVSTVVSRVQDIFKDCTSALAVQYVNEVDQDLKMRFPMVRDTEDLTLILGTTDPATGEYVLDDEIIRVWHAEYWESATYVRPLIAFDITAYDMDNPNWRHVPVNRPAFYAVSRNATQNVLTLYPRPSVATSGGYPFVRLYVSRVAATALTSSDALPLGLLSMDLYVFGVAARFASARATDKYDFYRARYEERIIQETQAQRRNVKGPAQHSMSWIPRVGRI